MTEQDARLVAPECADYGKPDESPRIFGLHRNVWGLLIVACAAGYSFAVWAGVV